MQFTDDYLKEDVLEKSVEKFYSRQIKKAGAHTRKFKSPATRGRADQLTDYLGCYFEVEIKRVSGKPSPLQLKEHNDVRKRGNVHTFVYGRGGVMKFIQDMLDGNDIAPEYKP